MLCSGCKETFPARAKFCPSCGEARPSRKGASEAPATTAGAVKQYAKEVAQEAGDLSVAALKSDVGKKMAAGAAVGAVIAIALPFVGPAVGAVFGAGIVAFRKVTK